MRTRELNSRSFFAFADQTQAVFDFVDAYLDTGLTLNQMPASFPVTPQLVHHANGLEAGLRWLFVTVLTAGGEDVSGIDDVIAEWRERQISSRERRSSMSAGRGMRQGYRNSDALRRAKIAYGLHLSLESGAPRGATSAFRCGSAMMGGARQQTCGPCLSPLLAVQSPLSLRPRPRRFGRSTIVGWLAIRRNTRDGSPHPSDAERMHHPPAQSPAFGARWSTT